MEWANTDPLAAFWLEGNELRYKCNEIYSFSYTFNVYSVTHSLTGNPILLITTGITRSRANQTRSSWSDGPRDTLKIAIKNTHCEAQTDCLVVGYGHVEEFGLAIVLRSPSRACFCRLLLPLEYATLSCSQPKAVFFRTLPPKSGLFLIFLAQKRAFSTKVEIN